MIYNIFKLICTLGLAWVVSSPVKVGRPSDAFNDMKGKPSISQYQEVLINASGVSKNGTPRCSTCAKIMKRMKLKQILPRVYTKNQVSQNNSRYLFEAFGRHIKPTDRHLVWIKIRLDDNTVQVKRGHEIYQ